MFHLVVSWTAGSCLRVDPVGEAGLTSQAVVRNSAHAQVWRRFRFQEQLDGDQ